MSVPSSTATLIRDGVRALLAALDPTDWPVIAGILPPGQPAQNVIGVVAYPAGDLDEELAAGQTITAVQVTIRGDAHAGSDRVLDMQQAIRDALTWITPRTVNTVKVVLSHRQLTSAPPIPDDQGRPTVYDTYDMRSGRPGLIPAQ